MVVVPGFFVAKWSGQYYVGATPYVHYFKGDDLYLRRFAARASLTGEQWNGTRTPHSTMSDALAELEQARQGDASIPVVGIEVDENGEVASLQLSN